MNAVVITFVDQDGPTAHAHVVALLAGARVEIVAAGEDETDVLVEDIGEAVARALGVRVTVGDTGPDGCERFGVPVDPTDQPC